MKITDLKPGMTVYDVHSYRMGNTTARTMGTWQVFIVAVDDQRRTVMAQWNGNSASKFSERIWKKWRLVKPMMIKESFGRYRLATREERAAAIAAKQACCDVEVRSDIGSVGSET